MKLNPAELTKAEQHGITGSPDVFFTHPDFWDCDCENDYIHRKSIGNLCPNCGAYSEDSPDSRVNEIEELYEPYKDVAEFKKG